MPGMRGGFLLYILLHVAASLCSALHAAPSDSNSFEWTIKRADLPKPKIALVLSGGGARGLAQIGVLRQLEAAGIVPDFVVGTSIGAIVGGMWCAGYNASELDSISRNTPWQVQYESGDERSRRDLFLDQKYEQDRSLLTLRFDNFSFVVPQSISAGIRFTAPLQKLFWNAPLHDNGNFDSLRVPFRAIATDIVHGKAVSLSRGNIVTAIKASATQPLRYMPVRIDSMLLVDGGLLANVPVEFAREFHPDLVICVNSTSPLLPTAALDKPWNVADQVVTLMEKQFNTRSAQKADFVIEPSIENHKNDDFTHVDSLIRKGVEAASAVCESVKARINFVRDSLFVNRYLLTSLPNNANNSIEEIELKVNKDNVTSFRGTDKFINLANSLLATFDRLRATHLRFVGVVTGAKLLLVATTSHTENIASEVSIQRIVTSGATDSLQNHLRTFLGQRFTDTTGNIIRNSVVRYYRARGNSFAELRNVHFDASRAILNIEVDEGLLRVIEISGNENTSTLFIERELNLLIGEIPSATNLVRAWENILNTDLFNEVGIEIRRLGPENSGVGVRVIVSERGSQLMRLGGRVDNERNAQLSADIIQENLFSTGVRLGLRIGGGARTSVASLRVGIPRILDSYWTFTLQGYWTARDLYRYNFIDESTSRYSALRAAELTEQHYGFRSLFGKQIETSGRIGVEFRYERQRVFELGDTVDSRVFEPLASLKISTVFDSENNAYFPTQGRVLALSLERSVFDAASKPGFTRAEFRLKENYSFGVHTFIPAMRFSFADASLPTPEFSSLGGEQLLYGMREDEMRSKQLALCQLEYRLRSPIDLLFDTYFSLRYDVGGMWGTLQDIKLSKLRHGVGAAIAFDTPLGPARISAGRSFYFVREPDAVVIGPYLFYFSIGMPLALNLQ